MITVSEINDLSELDGYRDLWRELWWKTRKASFFQSIEWFECYWRREIESRQSGESKRMRVFLVSMAKRPIGIVPLVARSVPSRVGALRMLTYPLDELGFFYGPIGASAAVTLTSVMRHLASIAREWDLIDLRHVDDDGCDHGRTLNAMRMSKLQTYRRVAKRRGIIECGDNWNEYWSARDRELRDELRRCEQALSLRGKIEYVRYRPEGTPLGENDPRWDLYNELEISGGTPCGPAAAATDADHATERFLRDVHEEAAGIAGVDFNVLRLDRRPIAWVYNYRCDGRIEMQRCHAVRDFESEARTVLFGRMLQDGIRRRDEYYLLDPATTRTMSGWQTGLATSYRYTHFSAAAPRAQAVRLYQWFKRRFDQREPAADSALDNAEAVPLGVD